MNKSKFGIFDIILAVMIAAGIGLNVYAFGFRGDAVVKKSPESPESQTVQVEKPPEDTLPETDTIKKSEQEPEQEAEQEFDPLEEAIAYEGDEMPTLGDFLWFTEDVKWDGIPKKKTVINDFNNIKGYWKAYEESIPKRKSDNSLLEFFNIEISGNANQLKLTYHMKNASGFSGKTVDVSAWDGDSYKGSFSGGKLVTGSIKKKYAAFTISKFYYIDDTQYAVGKIQHISGEKSHIALARP